MTDAHRFADHRGVIEDILAGPIDQVTRIFTRAGAVRGNHVHDQTEQWTFVVSGALECAAGALRTVVVTAPAGTLVHEPAGVPHAWRALEDTTVLVFTRGPRSGAAYESDTRRLDVPLISPGAALPADARQGTPADQAAWMREHIDAACAPPEGT